MLKVFLKKWIFLFIIIIFDLIIALRTSIEFFHFFFWFLISVVTISLAWLTVEYFGTKLSLTRRSIATIEEGDILEIETVISNNGFLPIINFVLEDRLTFAISQEREKRFLLEYLGPRSTLNLKYRCLCLRRGRYEIGPFSIYLFDPWGLFFLKKTLFLYSELYVYPPTFNIPKFPQLVKGVAPWFGIGTSRVSGDEEEFYGITEYRRGDPYKKIHWFSTARKNILIVKQFQHQAFFRATIIFNLNKDKNFGEGKESVAEYTIKIAASVAKYFIERNVSLGLIAHIGEIVHIPFNKGAEHLEDIFRALTIAQAESRISLDELFQEFAPYIPNDSSLIVIMLDQDWEFLPAMLSLKARNISLVPLILIASSFLHPSEKQKIIKYPEMELPQGFDFAPIFFSCGDNLEQDFIK
ncbi:MAG: hypothetical protein COX40_03860 [Candidatus Omnitrophica bacterium CG23_combo_of_CG06-09_8_20_14_all_40_11]|nr:MAG: hypothetical protein COX40_03860 [Candidatus Omnitrophica bacterium CG23_combo_of_CG06-09_8_20_14_all_40_11]